MTFCPETPNLESDENTWHCVKTYVRLAFAGNINSP